MLNLEKVLIPKPKKIDAKAKKVKLTDFNRPQFEIKETFCDARIGEGTKREALMLLAENVRIPATSYTYLRNMSVFRQFMLDLLSYFKREIAEGRKPIFDVTDLSYVTGEAFDFLR